MSRNPVPPRVPPGAIPTPAPAPATPVVDPTATITARPDPWYRGKRLLMVVALLAMGPWFAYDGWKRWPEQNRQTADLQHQLEVAHQHHDEAAVDQLNHNPLTHQEPHSDLAITIQKILAFALPIGGILFAIWTLRATRGVYQLTGDVLQVPGHPPVRLNEITAIDTVNWDRKGIAYLRYQTAAGATGRICLDDYVYERDPTDQIFDRAKATLHPIG